MDEEQIRELKAKLAEMQTALDACTEKKEVTKVRMVVLSGAAYMHANQSCLDH